MFLAAKNAQKYLIQLQATVFYCAMDERCRSCISHGLDTQAADGFMFCQACIPKLAPGICPKCEFSNGEFDDSCRNCGEAIIDASLDDGGGARVAGVRKLQQHHSHPEAPAKKAANIAGGVSPTSAPPFAPVDDEEDMKIMMRKMMGMMGKLTDDVHTMSAGVQEANAKAQQALTMASATDDKVALLQKTSLTKEIVQEMIDKSIEESITKKTSSASQSTGTTVSDIKTLIIGGIDCVSLEAAKTWISNLLKEKPAPPPVEMYSKGDTFNGLLWLRYHCPRDANNALSVIKGVLPRGSTNKVWANFDLPIEQRVMNTFLFSLKAQ